MASRGLAYALGILSASTGRLDFLDAAREGLRYERAYFRASEGNWPDLRSFVQAGADGRSAMHAGMVPWRAGRRVRPARPPSAFPDDASILAEAETAVRTTAATLGQASPGTGNFSLCHGDGGNADLLILAADVLSRPELRREAENAGSRALDRFEDTRSPWPCGVPGAGESPNLLLGLAGIGYFFLRLHDSEGFRPFCFPWPPSGSPRNRVEELPRLRAIRSFPQRFSMIFLCENYSIRLNQLAPFPGRRQCV